MKKVIPLIFSLLALSQSILPAHAIDDKFLKQNGIDAKAEKMNYYGKSTKVAHFDFYLDTNSGQLFIYRKGGIGEGVPSGILISMIIIVFTLIITMTPHWDLECMIILDWIN